jgi:hypothetical protein
MEVKRRIKVDLPQPESAATPMTTGVWPGAKAICKAEHFLEELKELDGLKAEAVVQRRTASIMKLLLCCSKLACAVVMEELCKFVKV